MAAREVLLVPGIAGFMQQIGEIGPIVGVGLQVNQQVGAHGFEPRVEGFFLVFPRRFF